MGFRFRQSIKVLPGLRIKFGLRGISATVGPRGANLNVSPRGTHLNLSLPGTGIGYRVRLDNAKFLKGRKPTMSPASNPHSQTPSGVLNPQLNPKPNLSANIIEFKSVNVASLGSESLKRVSALYEKLQRQRHTLSLEITQAEKDVVRAARMSKRFAWLRRWVAPETIPALQEYDEDCADRLAVLNEIKQALVLDV